MSIPKSYSVLNVSIAKRLCYLIHDRTYIKNPDEPILL